MPISDLFTKRERGAALLEAVIVLKRLLLVHVFSFTSHSFLFVQKFFILKATLLTSASSTSSAQVYIWVLLLDALLAGVMGKTRK